MDSAFDYPNPKVQHAQPKHGEWSTRNLSNERQKAFRVSMEQTIRRWQQRRDQNIAMPYHPCMVYFPTFGWFFWYHIWILWEWHSSIFGDLFGATTWGCCWRDYCLYPALTQHEIQYDTAIIRAFIHTNKHLVFEYILHYMFLRVH